MEPEIKAGGVEPEGAVGQRLLTAVLFIATALLLYLAYLIIRPFLPALAWALALAIISYPVYRRIRGWIRQESLSAGVSVAVVALIIVAPAIFVGQQVAMQVTRTLEGVRGGEVQERIQRVINRTALGTRVYGWVERNVNIGEAVNQSATSFAQRFTGFVTGSVAGVLGLVITFFFLFYFFRDCDDGLARIRGMLPLSHEETNRIFQRIYDTIQATVFGTMLVAAVQGALGGLMFWWLGLPGPVLWGVVMGLLAVIPVLGAFVIWVPAAIYLIIEGHWVKAVVLTAWGTVVIGLIDNLLYPIFMGRKLHLHTVPVFIAIAGGLVAFGVSGVILGPVILAVNMALVEVWRTRAQEGFLIAPRTPTTAS